MNGEAGKGSARRDGSDPEAYANGWDRIWGKKHGNQKETRRLSKRWSHEVAETVVGGHDMLGVELLKEVVMEGQPDKRTGSASKTE
jgi:hypothetical protein